MTMQVYNALPSPVDNYNQLINGGFDFFQRTAPGTLTAIGDDTYGPDRWNVLTQTNSVQVDRTAGNLAPNACRLKQNQVSAQRMGIEQIIEGYVSRSLRNRQVTFQFQVKNDSTRTIQYAILEWTGTLDAVTSDVVNDWTTATFTAGNFFLGANLTVNQVGSLSVGTGYTQVALNATLGASVNNIIVVVWSSATVAQNGTIEITEAMLSTGTYTKPWSPRERGEELRMCQRFYEKSMALDTAPGGGSEPAGELWTQFPHAAVNGNYLGINVAFLVAKRAAPTVTFYDMVGNSGKVSTMSAAGSNTNNVAPTAYIGYSEHGGFVYMASDGTIAGVRYSWTAESEL